MAAGEARLNEASQSARPRGRPRKDGAPAGSRPAKLKAVEAPGVEIVPAVQVLLEHGTAALAAARRCPAYKLEGETSRTVAQLLDACLKQYLPQVETQHANLIALSMVLGVHFGGAYLQERKLRADQERKLRAEEKEAA